MGHFPFEWHVDDLRPEDFQHFQKQFSETVLQLLPFADGPVMSVDTAGGIQEFLQKNKKPKYWQQYIKKVLRQKQCVQARERPVLFLPVWNEDTVVGAVAVEGIDKKFAHNLSEEWLSDRSRIMSRQFSQLKQSAIEPVTGMFNGRHFCMKLEELLTRIHVHSKNRSSGVSSPGLESVSLLLIEIHPRVNNAEKALHHIMKAGYFLELFLGQGVLHHLGSGVFGLASPGQDEEQAKVLGNNILSWFRREGFSRIHIGIKTVDAQQATEAFDSKRVPACDLILEQTWAALRKASRRGPYALCTYESINNPEIHPLRRPKPAVMARLRRLWTDSAQFAVLILRRDKENSDEPFSRRLLALIGPTADVVQVDANEAYVFLPDSDPDSARSWAGKLERKLSADLAETHSIGIAYYPCAGFKRAEIPHNARKALLHGSFFGPGTVTVYNGISQNVSGDMYYGEGDLVRAVKEYKKGLELEPENTNLLNSLGEAYGRMARPKMARYYFEKVLAIDKKHYMALFNLGITHLTTGEDREAVKYFEKAFPLLKKERQENLVNDLVLQLAKLYCRTGSHKKVISLLTGEKIIRDLDKNIPGRKAYLRYLGDAYRGTGKNKEAVNMLQKAVRYNPHDAYSLSLLGELYAIEGQGDDIALSLCEEAVNIDDKNYKHWYRLSLVQSRMERFGAALESVKKCLTLEPRDLEALFLAGRLYVKLHKKNRAAVMFNRITKVAPGNKAAAAALQRLKEN